MLRIVCCLRQQLHKLPNICVVGGCSNVTDTEKGISLHFIPFTGDEMHEAKIRRRVDFVHLKTVYSTDK